MTRTAIALTGLILLVQIATLVNVQARRIPISSCEYRLAELEHRAPMLRGAQTP